MPAAVPAVLKIIVAPRGIIAWIWLAAGILRPRASKKLRSSASQAAFNSSGSRSTAASAWRGRSSSVGPMPPEMIRKSHRPTHSSIACSIEGWSSATVRWAATAQPTAASCWLSQAELVSTVWPRTNSSPMERMMARMSSGGWVSLSCVSGGRRGVKARAARGAGAAGGKVGVELALEAADDRHQPPALACVEVGVAEADTVVDVREAPHSLVACGGEEGERAAELQGGEVAR